MASSRSPSISHSISRSVSPSSSVSPSISSSVSSSASPSSMIEGSTVWGQSSYVTEDNIRTFANNWTGTGTVQGTGDDEHILLVASQYMESEISITGANTVVLTQNHYQVGNDVYLKYRTGATEEACSEAEWAAYTIPFESLGYTQVRIEV